MNVIIFGATGMIGAGVLTECLKDPRISTVLVVGRSPCGVAHPKLTEVLHQDFQNFGAIADRLTGDACFFCLGVSAAGLSEKQYHRLTHDITLAAATILAERNPEMTFCYVSGAGTDSTEGGRMMWARVKGMTENHLLQLPFSAAFMFRPGYVQPQPGQRSKTALYRITYNVVAPFYPLLRRVAPNHVTTSVAIGQAMIQVASAGHAEQIVDIRAINALAEASGDTT
jgi:uncharacterized protein YbjT (DUF2867 family)